MTARKDITGQRFGRLTAMAVVGIGRTGTQWQCACDCGHKCVALITRLVSGRKKSCGCLKTDTHAARLTTHGMTGSPEYASWMQMLQRCTNPNDKRWPRYGGRGIAVAPQWRKFEVFYADMGKRPPGTSLDRINNDGNYEPGNCHWASPVTQSNNTARNRLVTAFGETLTASQWARKTGVKVYTLFQRLRRGFSPEEAVSSQRYSTHYAARRRNHAGRPK